MTKKILLITTDFPPIISSGVFRNIKFIKYLSRYDYSFVVLTPSRKKSRPSPEFRDENLLEEIPHNTIIKRVKNSLKEKIEETFEELKLSRFLRLFYLTDGDLFNLRQLIKRGEEIIKEERIDLVYVSMPGFATNSMIGRALKKRFRVPMILDFRDPWIDNAFIEYETIIHYWMNKYLEKKAIMEADGIIVVTKGHKEILKRRYGEFRKKIIVINNGYDEADFKNFDRKEKGSIFNITYTGVFYGYKPEREKKYKKLLREIYNIGKYYPYRVRKDEINTHTPYYFFKALKVLFERSPQLRSRIRLNIAGGEYIIFKKLAEELGIEGNVHFYGQVKHSEVIKLLSKADLLLYVLLSKTENNRSGYWVPGKTYEYLRSGKPILALVPEGDAKDILEEAGTAFFADPTSPEEIADLLERLYQHHIQGGIPVQPNWEFIQQFERSRQAKKLAEFLDQILEQAKNPSSQ